MTGGRIDASADGIEPPSRRVRDRRRDQARVAHRRDLVDPQHRAPAATASTFVATVPPSRSPTSRPVSLPMKLLREVPTTIGRPSVAQLAEPPQQLEVVLERLAEPDPRVDPDPLLGDPGGDGGVDPLGEERPDVVDDVVVDAGPPASSAACRACA